MAGPIIRAALNIDEFNAIAFIRCSFPTISTIKDCRPGISKAFTTPSDAARTKISQTLTTPNSVSAARMSARIMDAVCVPITTRCRLCRSATIPPKGATRNTGNCPANPTAPNSKDDPVSRYTNQAWAMFCIHVPIREMSWPLKNSWKLRCSSARSVTGNPRVFGPAPGGACSILISEAPESATSIFHRWDSTTARCLPCSLKRAASY